jgi:hypothetical protein
MEVNGGKILRTDEIGAEEVILAVLGVEIELFVEVTMECVAVAVLSMDDKECRCGW